LQLSDYDSAYSQQRVDVNTYNTKQEAVQQQIEVYQQQQYANDGYNTEGYATEGYATDGYGDGYNYASNGEYASIFLSFHNCIFVFVFSILRHFTAAVIDIPTNSSNNLNVHLHLLR